MVACNLLLVVLGLAFLPVTLADSGVFQTTVANSAAIRTCSTFSTVVTQTPSHITAQILAEAHGPNYSGALAPTPHAPPVGARTTQGPDIFTFAYTNLAGVDLTTTHDKIPDAPTPIGGMPGPGIMKKGATASILAPTAWAGKIPWPYGVVDVSYVDGYTLPIICKCRAAGVFMGGCIDPKLWQQSLPCPSNNGQGACKNPHRGTDATEAHRWFAPCAGRAYTFDGDNTATHNGLCQSGTVDCEIHPK
ncbi:hypothetical protein QBC43DRAFT_341537 [Cladorrhinum sp. PSN259]|nr:hypothetical protein QBC43DRAFT_341537 [Cladorrhinum sp. PSN259]